ARTRLGVRTRCAGVFPRSAAARPRAGAARDRETGALCAWVGAQAAARRLGSTLNERKRKRAGCSKPRGGFGPPCSGGGSLSADRWGFRRFGVTGAGTADAAAE